MAAKLSRAWVRASPTILSAFADAATSADWMSPCRSTASSKRSRRSRRRVARISRAERVNGMISSTNGLPSSSGAQRGLMTQLRRLCGKLCLRLATAGRAWITSPIEPSRTTRMRNIGSYVSFQQFERRFRYSRGARHASCSGDRWDTRASGRGCTRLARGPPSPADRWDRWSDRRLRRIRRWSVLPARRRCAWRRNRWSDRRGTPRPGR